MQNHLYVMVKTVINGWQKEYTPELTDRVEKWINDNLAETDMRFPNVWLNRMW